ncbi:hypothetical protein D3C81_2069050 [compost metagenome]
MRDIQRPLPTDRQADAVQRQRVLFAYPPQEVMKRPAGHHVVFRVHLEKAQIRSGLEHLTKMLALEPQPCPWRQPAISGEGGGIQHVGGPQADAIRTWL